MNMAVWSPAAGFAGHSLAEQTRAPLMDRIDTKFMVPVAELGQCLRGLEPEYSMLEIHGTRSFPYDTLYLDTPDNRLYLDHHNGKLNRFKLRIRHYRQTGESFLEVKKKCNRQRTLKSRLSLPAGRPDLRAIKRFLSGQFGLPAAGMQPALFVRYDRMTLLRRDGLERVTVDTRLVFESPDCQRAVPLPGLAILEIKYDRKGSDSPLMARLAGLGYRPVTFSKYCVGRVLLNGEHLKSNRFKPLLRSVHGICS
ncbi:polyphosphate polymerase domain-containing protein [Marinobacter sp. VGCF2001]|uniref:polyphosphate polymerase domain-containing protein n=1 Tax=Marinobacter sp. VGCF2001 TaxID=3417189 RepID=UPI003CEC5706